ncbi:ABC transporter permease protein [Treponema primitia ZAS-2]|uniref:ABC transporter permease protein n=1 Tax=Treponema primitia (strain ATCC BAA-887 / DSM 12427 / ZAS-2) TaxID=545694 RepID=F5YH02_TREPZ|nr:ABC transporter permease [Treponema primitia]AEF83884.1 ABC transporter permease protein [Treponema primitia ZAS-2]
MKIISQRALALARKELYSHCNSPAFYGIAVFFLLFTSIWLFYIQRYFAMDMASLRVYFAAFPLAFILVIPVITMKSWAEERKLGSVELLLTMPFSEWELVLGKFISSLAVMAFIIVLTIPVPLSLLPLGRFDGGVIFGEYIGSLLLASAATALGLLLSSLSKNQAGAFLGGAVALMAVMLIQQITQSFDLPPWLAEGINFISLAFHFESFSKGLIDSRDLAFFITATVLFLFLNTRVILYRKWR